MLLPAPTKHRNILIWSLNVPGVACPKWGETPCMLTTLEFQGGPVVAVSGGFDTLRRTKCCHLHLPGTESCSLGKCNSQNVHVQNGVKHHTCPPPWNFKEGLWWLSQVDLTHSEEPNVATCTHQAQKHAHLVTESARRCMSKMG